MKYEEWIKYEEIRQNQPDQFAWIASPDLSTGKPTHPQELLCGPYQGSQPKKNFWILIYRRIVSRRI